MRLIAVMLALCAARAGAGAAPEADAAADFPAGWCDERHGTPTRTTGECMCKGACAGAGCRREQGFVWYAYESCPTCACVAGSDAGAADSAGPDDDAVEAEEPAPDPARDDELTFGGRVFEFVDDHGEKVLGVLFTLVLLAFLVPAVLATVARPAGEAPPPAGAPAPARAAAAASDDSDSDDADPKARRKRTPRCD